MKDFILKNYIHIWHVAKFVSFSCGKYKVQLQNKIEKKNFGAWLGIERLLHYF